MVTIGKSSADERSLIAPALRAGRLSADVDLGSDEEFNVQCQLSATHEDKARTPLRPITCDWNAAAAEFRGARTDGATENNYFNFESFVYFHDFPPIFNAHISSRDCNNTVFFVYTNCVS